MSEQATETDPVNGRLQDTARSALAASALLLRPPDERIHEQLQATDLASMQTLETHRQSFYDRFCIPQSGLYIPPYEHVFRQREEAGNHWYFPPARFGAACEVESVYANFRFRRSDLDADPVLRAPHLPGDHLGFMLAFIGWVLADVDSHRTRTPEVATQLRGFIAAHLDGWVDVYCDLLRESDPDGYPAAVGDAVHEAVAQVRAIFEEPV